MATKKCEICGALMENVRRDRKFCTNCAPKQRKKRREEWREKHSAAAKNTEQECDPSVQNCLHCTRKKCNGAKGGRVKPDEKQAIIQQHLSKNCCTADMLRESL